MLFSIILAVRNKEKYIIKTINSCVKQNIGVHNFEIIIINDASTDKTEKKIKKKIYKYSNITLKNLTTNVGPGIARNYGLNISRGKYIVFVDGDDELAFNALKNLKKKISTNPDIVTFNFNKISNNNKKISARKDFFKITKKKTKLINNFLSGEIDGSVIFTCFKKNFLKKNRIKFPKGLHEDIIFIFKSYLLASKIIKFNKILYIKNEVKNSITRTISKNRINDLMDIHLKLIKILKQYRYYRSSMLNFAKKGFVGYVADTVKDLKKETKINKNIKKKILSMILIKSLKFPDINQYNYLTKKDFVFKKFIN